MNKQQQKKIIEQIENHALAPLRKQLGAMANGFSLSLDMIVGSLTDQGASVSATQVQKLLKDKKVRSRLCISSVDGATFQVLPKEAVTGAPVAEGKGKAKASEKSAAARGIAKKTKGGAKGKDRPSVVIDESRVQKTPPPAGKTQVADFSKAAAAPSSPAPKNTTTPADAAAPPMAKGNLATLEREQSMTDILALPAKDFVEHLNKASTEDLEAMHDALDKMVERVTKAKAALRKYQDSKAAMSDAAASLQEQLSHLPT